MNLRGWLGLALVSTAGFIPAPLGGQSVQAPGRFEAVASGDQVLARWTAVPRADLYVGEIDTDPRFGDAREWLERDDGRGVYEQRLTNLRPATYYLRVRAVQSAFLIRRQSNWSHVERVVVGGGSGRVGGFPGNRSDGRFPDDRWPGDRRDDRWPDDARFPGGAAYPRSLDARSSGDELFLRWTSVRGADRYTLQLDREPRFRSPASIDVRADGGSTEEIRLRNVPEGRWYIRVRALDGVGLGGTRWSPVESVVVGDRRIARRPGTDRRDVVFRDDRRDHPVFDRDPDRGRGHANHTGKPDTPGHARDRDRRDGEWWGDDDRGRGPEHGDDRMSEAGRGDDRGGDSRHDEGRGGDD
jgi:hypothetical protein